MKRLSRMLGVTLLEIMLVLAIAAMVIVMSIRYYQSATLSQQSNDVMQKLLAITAAADNLSQGSGSYGSLISTTNIGNIVGSNNMKTPWTSANPFSISGGGTSYNVSVDSLPAAVCTNLQGKFTMGAGTHYSNVGCSGSGNSTTFKFTYNINTQ